MSCWQYNISAGETFLSNQLLHATLIFSSVAFSKKHGHRQEEHEKAFKKTINMYVHIVYVVKLSLTKTMLPRLEGLLRGK